MPFIGVDWVPSAMSRQLSARNRSCKARKKTKPSRKGASFSPTALVNLSHFNIPPTVVALMVQKGGGSVILRTEIRNVDCTMPQENSKSCRIF